MTGRHGSDTPAHVLFARDVSLARRMRTQRVAEVLLGSAAALAVLILALLVTRLAFDGVRALSWTFFTSPYSPLDLLLGRPTGVADSLLASLVVLVFTMLFAVPVGVAGAVYLNEYAAEGRFRRFVQGWIANLAAVPSVVYGLLGLAVFVRFFLLGPNMLAASLTLALLILPVVIVSTQEALKAVPGSIREASFAMGATRWQTVRHHVLPSALPGILTGNILALSRAAGETAPLIVIGVPTYTTLVSFDPRDSGTPLQLKIFSLAREAGAGAHELAAGAVIVLVAATLLLNLAAILIRHRLSKSTRW